MSRQSDWNKSIHRRLEGKIQADVDAITNICVRNAEICRTVMEEKTPVKYGGLKASLYSQVNNTPTGLSVVVGYSNRQHIRLNPIDPGYDKFSNIDLLEFLENSEKTSNDVLDIRDAMTDCIQNTYNDIQEYWKTKR